MCQSVKSAVDVLESQSSRKSLTRKETLMLFKKVIEDSERTDKRLISLENDMADVKTDVKAIRTLLEQKNKGFWEKVPLLKDIPNLTWILLIVLVCVLGSLLGANLDFLQNAFHIGG